LRNLENVTTDIVENILKYAKKYKIHKPSITKLDISHCYSINNSICDVLRDHTKLEALKAAGLSNAIDDDNFHILSELDNLAHLDVALCTYIGDTCLEKFALNKKPHSIQSLGLSSLLKITSKGLKALISSQANSLNYLDIATLPQVDFVIKIENG
jgi:hypothetical protein